MQNISSRDCMIYDGTPNHSSPINLPIFKSTLSNNASLSSIEEMDTEEISTEVFSNSPSPLLLHNNKRQQIPTNKGMKRTCLEKAFSTMTTSPNQYSNEEHHSDIQNQENVCPEYNSMKTNFISACSVSEVIKNDLKREPNGKILMFPNDKHTVDISSDQFNNKNKNDSKQEPSGKILMFPNEKHSVDISSDQFNNKIKNDSKQEPSGKILMFPNEKPAVDISSNQFNNKVVKDYGSVKNISSHKNLTVYSQKRNAFGVYGDSEESTEDDLYEKERKERRLNRTKLNYKSKDRKGKRKCKSVIGKKSYVNGFESDDSSPNRLNCRSVKSKYSNEISQNDSFDFTELSSHCKQTQDISELPSTSSKTARNKFKSSKINKNKNNHNISKVFMKQVKDSDTDGVLPSSKINKHEHKFNSTKNKNSVDNYKHSLASTSSRNETVKFRRIQPRRGNIVKYPVEDSDSEIEFYDAKYDVSDISKSKRTFKTNSKRRQQKDWNSNSECFLDDSCSDISVVSEKHYSPSDQNWRNTESPDPVEQVRQMEEDEKLALRLQAQFDAEVNLNNATESEDFDFDSSFLSGLHVDNFSNSSDTSSSSTTEGFPFVVPFSPNLHRVTNNSFLYGVERVSDRRRSPRLQQSFMEWIPGRIRNVLSSLMPHFPEYDYEALLQLTENIGDECQGLKKQQVNSLPTRKFFTAQSTSKCIATGSETSQECKDCTICLCEYQNNDLLRLLPCSHEFHANCIDRWLKSHRTCPICRVEVSVKRQYGKKRKS